MDINKQNHPFILKFREKDRHTVEFLFCMEFRNNETLPIVALFNIETKCKSELAKNSLAKPFIARLLETIKKDRDLAIEYGELWRIK